MTLGAWGGDPVSYSNSLSDADSVVTFNEVQYQPPGGDSGLEWIEIHNQHAVLEDLSRWVIEGGVDFRFPTGTTLAGGGYLVVAADPVRFRAATGIDALGPFARRLSDAGDRLVLRNLNGRLMDELAYGDSEPWPVAADGTGATLAKKYGESPSGPPENWRASVQVGGTPGAINFPEPGPPPPRIIDTLISGGSTARWRVPVEAEATETWQEAGFSDATWREGKGGFGYSAGAGPGVGSPSRYYRFEGTMADGSGNATHGTLQNGVRYVTTPGPVSGSVTSLRFDGVDDLVQIQDPGAWPAYTLSVWVRCEVVRPCSLIVRTDDGGPDVSWSHQLRITDGGVFQHYTFDGEWNLVTGTTVIEPGRWYHVAATAESGGVARLFVNGLEEGIAEPVGIPWTGGLRWQLGTRSQGFPNAFQGWMDDVGIWNRPLAGAEIAALASGSVPPLGGGGGGSGAGFPNLIGTDLAVAARGVHPGVRLRYRFDAPSSAGYDQLTFRVRYDDGFVAWLNGEEVVRRNAPAALAWNSTATAARSDPEALAQEIVDLGNRTDLLRPRDNVLAVQSLNIRSDDGDLLWHGELSGRRRLADIGDVPSIAFSEVAAAGDGDFFCELVNGGSGAVNLSGLALGSSNGGRHRFEAGELGPGKRMTIRGSELGFGIDAGDRLFLMGSGGVQVIDAVQLRNVPQARRGDESGSPFYTPARLTPGAANAIEFRDEIVINEILYHAPPTFSRPGVPAEAGTRAVVDWDAEWRYQASGAEPAAGWKGAGFDDAAWSRGAGLLGNRAGAVPRPLKTTLPLGQIAYYFRVPFIVESTNGLCGLRLSAIVDDGAVIYLNGREIWRIRMPEGEVRSDTLGVNQGDPPVDGPMDLDLAGLVRGTNWLAMEVHQWNRDSSDVVAGVELAECLPLKPGEAPTAYSESGEQWVELYNRSDRPVDLSDWEMGGDVRFRFQAGTRLEIGEHVVVAGDGDAVRRSHPEIRVLGDWRGRLGRRSGHVVLRDPLGNPADEVRYHDDHPWPARADGGGSSLELRDVRSDNSVPGAWAASDESARSAWKTYSYRAVAVAPVKAPAQNGFHEFRMGLLADGAAYLDDISVIEEPDGARRQLIQNGSFEDARAWRLLGNHSHSKVVDDPERAGNKVLHLIATDARGYMHNQLETTLKAGGVVVPVVAGRTYEISFRARWAGGSPLLHTELYYNKIARTTVLDLPPVHGTPGRANSTRVENLGPTYEGLVHDPLVPAPGQVVTVRVQASDPDGVASLELFASVNGGAWQQRSMVPGADGVFSATLAGQSVDSVVQFYVEGRDGRGASTTMPLAGRESRALYRVDTRMPGGVRKAFRFVLTPSDGRLLDAATNMMSDDRMGATVVWSDREVFYDCGVHLHGSMFSRGNVDATPYNVKFPADHKFRGVHRTVQLNRGAIEEIIAKHAQNQAGIPGMYEDIVEVYSHRRGNAGAARLSLAHYNDIYLASQFENGADGLLYNMEGIRVLQSTHNGSVEGIKLGSPADWVGDYDIMNLGDDPEQYRFSTTLRNNRARNDHGPYIAMAKAFSLSGAALEQAAARVIDVDEWMRYYALLTLFEVGDTYTLGNPHNIGFYARPSDGRILALPYDWDFFFSNGDTSPLWGNQNLSKIIARPVYTRLLHGHLLDLIESTFTAEYLTPYVANFGQVAGQSYTAYLGRVRARGQYVRSRLPARMAFEITSNGGADFVVDTPEVTLEGRGWIDVREVRVAGLGAMPLTWLDGTRWRLSLPLVAATNRVSLQAFNHRGEQVGADEIGVTTTRMDDGQRRFLRIAEILYHPSDATPSEAAAGYTENDFEFVEIANHGETAVSLAGLRLEGAVRFAWDGASTDVLGAHSRVLVVRHPAAFAMRYGNGLPVAGVFTGGLSDSGETLRLVDRFGVGIHQVTYDDAPPWPAGADGDGHSLELISPDGPVGEAAGWRLGPLGGSPGFGAFQVEPPVVLGLRRDGETVHIRFSGRAAHRYRLQVAEVIGGKPWVDQPESVRLESDGESELIHRWEGEARYFRIVTE